MTGCDQHVVMYGNDDDDNDSFSKSIFGIVLLLQLIL